MTANLTYSSMNLKALARLNYFPSIGMRRKKKKIPNSGGLRFIIFDITQSDAQFTTNQHHGQIHDLKAYQPAPWCQGDLDMIKAYALPSVSQ